MSVTVLGVVVMLAACAVVIVLLRNPKALKWVAIPFAILVLLGAISIVIALSAPRYGTVVPATEWLSDQPLRTQEPRLPSAPAEVSTEARQHSIDRIVATRQAAIDRQIAAMQRRHDDTARVQSLAWERLAIIGLVLMAVIGVCIAIPVLCRKWIVRHKEIALPAAGVLSIGALGLASVLLAGLFYVRTAAVPSRVRYVPAHRSAVVPEPLVVPVSDLPADDADRSAAVADSASAGSGSVPPAETPATAGVDTAVSDDAAADVPAQLPDWIRNHVAEINNLDHTPLILASDRWATIEECEAQIQTIASAALAHQLRRQRVVLSDWQPTPEFIRRSGALRQQFVEESRLQVGGFESPMYRSYWEVDVSPAVSDLAYSQWKAATVERRVLWLGGGAGGLTLLFGAIAAALRIDADRSRPYRGAAA